MNGSKVSYLNHKIAGFVFTYSSVSLQVEEQLQLAAQLNTRYPKDMLWHVPGLRRMVLDQVQVQISRLQLQELEILCHFRIPDRRSTEQVNLFLQVQEEVQRPLGVGQLQFHKG